MVDQETSVLVIHSSNLQAELWQAALRSQNIWAILESSDVNLHEITEALEGSDRTIPTLLLVDLGLKNLNAYALCRWCKENRPDLKIVLTSEQYDKMSSSPVRQWAIEQGAQELLPKFDLASLTSSTLMCLDRVLGILDHQVPDIDALIAALMNFCKTTKLLAGAERTSLTFNALPSSTPASLQPESRTIPVRKANERISEQPEDLYVEFHELKALPREQVDASKSLPFQSVTAQDRYLLWGETPKWFFILLGMILLGMLGGAVGYLLLQQLANRAPQLGVNQSAIQSAAVQGTVKLPSGLFTYGGSTTWSIISQQVWPKLQGTNPQFRLRYMEPLKGAPGSNTGIRMLVDGELDLALSSRPLKAEEYAATRQRGFSIVQHPVAIDSMAVVVHPTLKLSGLTLKQLQQIYRGEIRNWKELGGDNLPITPLSRPPEDSGAVNYFLDKVLKGQPFGSNVKYLNSTTEAIRVFRRIPGGIYFGSAPTMITQCQVKTLAIGKNPQSLTLPYQATGKALPNHCQNQTYRVNTKVLQDGSYPLTYKLYLIAKDDHTVTEQAGEAYIKLLLSEQGQAAIAAAGFLRIR